jgi:hypothetical protein
MSKASGSPAVNRDHPLTSASAPSIGGIDAGKQLWHVKVGRPSPAQERACGDIDPLGITGTPIYSAQTGDVYLVAEHNGWSSSGPPEPGCISRGGRPSVRYAR